MRKKPAQQLKVEGTFREDRHGDIDFKIQDGLLQLNPEPPKDYTVEMVEMWNRAWRHLVKHQYGKEIDLELVNTLVFEWFQYLKYRPFDHTAKLAKDAFSNYLAASNALCLNPNALGRAAILQKGVEKKGLNSMLKKKQA